MDNTFALDAVPADLRFTLTHTFDAPAEKLFEAFTSAEILPQWFGPEGWYVPLETVEIDPRIGGVQRFTMVNGDDEKMQSPVNAVFVNIIDNELIEGREEMPGADGQPSGNYVYMRTTFESLADNTTRVILDQGPLPAEFHEPGRAGWLSSFNKLNKVLGN